MPFETHRHVVVVGAGLVGSLLAVFLKRRGFEVDVWEGRPDIRQATEGGRSINLVVSSRGVHALRQVGCDQAVSKLTVPVAGRMMHSVEGELTYQPYGRDDSECNYSVSRSELNGVLIDEAARRGARFHFERRLIAADLEAGRLTFSGGDGRDDVSIDAPVVFGTDGAGSAVRSAMQQLDGYSESIEMLGHGYKELLIPAAEGGKYRIEVNALHIWPRGRLMLMALPNLDGSFTVTLYLPERGPSSFEELDAPERVRDLFEREFRDAIPLIPDLEQSFFANPTGELGTVRCRPWHVGGRAVLLGDAAHAIVPFFGQGMNSGFEDCTELDRLMDEHGDDAWPTVFDEFTRVRKPHADAIADMALENFVEMRDRVGDAQFLLRKQVEHRLESERPAEYRSRYSMVMYGSVPYRLALEAGLIQQGLLDDLCRGLPDAAALDMERARRMIRERLTPFLESHGIRLDY